ncbi:translocation/assembly module TamB domain-containing protein [Novosphingopyxis sp.]|uniref:translocation/assembly module TamB domain-containing protein n=1 Tax=Novosphingopyxis sp. TaxID=2709690 RepID=UPI003B5C20C1
MTAASGSSEHAAVETSARRRLWQPIVLSVMLALLLAITCGVIWLDSAPGHRWIAARISAGEQANGLRVGIDRIDGSIYSNTVLRGVSLSDPKGLFFTARRVDLDWFPLVFLSNRLSIDRLAVHRSELLRKPQPKPTGGPLLPDFDIYIGAFSFPDIRIDAAVAGREQIAELRGNAEIRDNQLRAMLTGVVAGSGDSIDVTIDIDPDEERFALEGDLLAPKDGVVAALLGFDNGLSVQLQGKGGWRRWNGQLKANSGGAALADLTLGARSGYYSVMGSVEADRLVNGALARLSAPTLSVDLAGRVEDGIWTGRGQLSSRAVRLALNGGYDLREGGFDAMRADMHILDPAALSPDFKAGNLRVLARLDGPPRGLRFDYRIAADDLFIGKAQLFNIRASGDGRLVNGVGMLPIRLQAGLLDGLGSLGERLFSDLTAEGRLRLAGSRLRGDDLAVTTRSFRGRADVDVALNRRDYLVRLVGRADNFALDGLGLVDIGADLDLSPGAGGKLTIAGDIDAVTRRFDNAFLRDLAGGQPRLRTKLIRGVDGLFRFPDFTVTAPLLNFTGGGLRNRDGTFDIKGVGSHQRWGRFDMALVGRIERPRLVLDLDSPFDTAKLANVRLVLDPTDSGFAYRAEGGSVLGPFSSSGNILLPKGSGALFDIERLVAADTVARGRLRPENGGLTGSLAVGGGGVNGNLRLIGQPGGQRIQGSFGAKNARFGNGGDLMVRTADGTIDAFFTEGRSDVDATLRAQGISQGNFVLGTLDARAKIVNGSGNVAAKLAGTRGSRFAFDARAAVSPSRVSVTGSGAYRRQPIRLGGPAVFVRSDGGWRLRPASLSYGGGTLRASGRFGGGANAIDLRLNDMPLALLDLAYADLGLGGRATGTLDYQGGAQPTGNAKLRVRGLSRSGLFVSSRPLDIGVNAALSQGSAAMRAVVQNRGATVGRVQARISNLPASGTITDRLYRGRLFAQARYSGEAGTLWRLTDFELFDLSGPVELGADIGGSLTDPVIRGVVRTEGAKLESGVSGTVVTGIAAQGRFNGSRLLIGQLSGKVGRGKVTGAGSFDFSGGRGVAIDLDLAADNAELIDREDFAATVTGPLKIKSSGQGGTISGKVLINESRFTLGNAEAREQLPELAVREVNRPADDSVTRQRGGEWRFAIDARAPDEIAVTGLGLDSEWQGDFQLSGLVNAPVIQGQAELIRGDYEFAGREFRLSRGFIRFRGDSPPDPSLDIVALADTGDINATINVTGTGQKPEIRFASVPALPEEELLARLLFGSSVTNLSAPEAVQLASAVAGLRSGGGLDPINAVRRAAGLDRLRILPADTETGQGTSLAAGKYLTRRTYVELITDGRGYSATRVEFQITRWLSLLSSISTIGRQSVNARVSKDY